LFAIAEHFTKRERQSGWYEKKRKDKKEIRKGIWAFKGVSCVGVEESASVGASMLDSYLGSCRAYRDALDLAFKCGD
jgi:hypothetical protein